MTADQAARYFEKRIPSARFTGKRQLSVHCCFHDDRTPSLSINTEQGTWTCHAGCGSGGVLDFEQRFSGCDRETATAKVQELLGDRTLFARKQKPDATYRYVDAHGKLLAEKLRFTPKRFLWRVPDGKSFSYKLPEGFQKPLYRLDELIRSTYAVIVEGEKDADNVTAALAGNPHLAVTTAPDGASRPDQAVKWLPEYSPYFAGKIVSILPDNDEPGRHYAESIARAIAPYAAGIRVCTLPGLSEHGDASDYLKTHSGADLLAEIKQAPQWRPAESAAWRTIFHSMQDFENSRELTFAIENILQNEGISLVAGLASHAKTLFMMAMKKALLTGEPLFDCDLFKVPQAATRVIYLVPESAIGPFWARIKLFGLQSFIANDRLLVRTLSHPEQVELTDERLLSAAAGAHIFLDTAVRFMSGNENDAEASNRFAGTLFRLLAAGAKSITAAHHAPKSFESCDHPSLESVLRGSSDIGALACTVFALRQINSESNAVYVTAVKTRDFEAPGSFVIAGRPFLDESGNFKMVEQPGQARSLRFYLDQERDRDTGGRPPMPDKDGKMRKAAELRAKGLTIREIAANLKIGKSSVDRFLFQFDLSQRCPSGTGYGTEKEPGPSDGERGDGCEASPRLTGLVV